MGSSMKKKKEKAKDFKKPKLRVGKAKAKPDNYTDTSFTARHITVTQQSLALEAKSASAQFLHYISLASSSKSDTQRRDALAYLTSVLITAASSTTTVLPTSAPYILNALLPLLLDGSSAVRQNLLKLLQTLPKSDVSDGCSAQALLYIRAGMTSLAPTIRDDAVSALLWLLDSAGADVVECAGGWMKTLKAFIGMMGWSEGSGKVEGRGGWSSAPKGASVIDSKAFSKQISALAQFLQIGLCAVKSEDEYQCHDAGHYFPLWDVGVHAIPRNRNPYGFLNLFGAPRDEDSEMYIDRVHRQRVFRRYFEHQILNGMEAAKKEAGEMGRAAAVLSKVVREGMADADEDRIVE